MFLAHEQDATEKYFFFLQGSDGAGKNELVSQYTCLFLISPSNMKYQNKIITGCRILT